MANERHEAFAAYIRALAEREARKLAGQSDGGDWFNPAPPVGSREESVRDDAQWDRDDEPEDDDGA